MTDSARSAAIREGIARARARGVKLGRPRVRDNTSPLPGDIVDLYEAGASVSTIARELNISIKLARVLVLDHESKLRAAQRQERLNQALANNMPGVSINDLF
jgi:DNA-binding NarL/FixJ family response regulator